MTEPSAGLSYGELLRLTEGHGTSEVYERITRALAEKDAVLAEARRERESEATNLARLLAEARRERDEARGASVDLNRRCRMLEQATSTVFLWWSPPSPPPATWNDALACRPPGRPRGDAGDAGEMPEGDVERGL